ncbi:MAG: hypothetical protein KC483_10760, partial [Nitrosarchaeum sp.]|nr:hypothetical protein [Nitrosarchaeum sp.]
LAPVNRIVFSNNDTITLMSLAYLFIDEDETNINTTYNSPKFSGAEPSSPSTGDYWFDISNDIWKVYNGSAFVASGDTFIGLALLDDTDCLAARCVDFAAQYSREINISIDQPSSSTQLTAKYQDSLVNVAGKQIKYFYDLPMFDITTDLATSADMYDATEQASRRYYLYVTDSGQEIISDVHPYYEFQKFGFYHPHNPWRAIGYVDNNGSSNFARNDMFKAVLDEQYVDEYSFLITATDSYSVGSNQDLVFDSSVDITGSNSMASATSPNFIFTKRGWYQHTFFISGGTTSGSATIDMDLYNTTKSTVHFSGYPQMIFPQTTSYSLRGVYSIPALFEIRDIDSSYKIRISVGTGTVDVYDYISYFRRFKGLHL